MTRFQQLEEVILEKLEKELSTRLTYHNVEHTKDVIQASAHLADCEGIGAAEKELLLTAALFHDSGYLEARVGHEALSCDVARDYLPRYGFNAREIEEICGMIMATRLPQSPKTRLEEILCDADLDYLGRVDFFVLSLKLFAEMKHWGVVSDELAWDRQQVEFIGGHRYFTAAANRLRQPQKEAYVEWIKSKI